MDGKWIWLSDGIDTENERGCFATEFNITNNRQDILVTISAITKYIIYLNGKEFGRGPIRSGRDRMYYDSYDISSLVKEGRNYLAIRVWNYGWSTYQSLAQEGGLMFTVQQKDQILVKSDRSVRCSRDIGHRYNVPKRNVNLGFTDYYDASVFDSEWVEDINRTTSWSNAAEIAAPDKELLASPIKPFHWMNQCPEQVIRIQDVKKGCQQVTVNTRKAFFGDRRDADETIFTGFIGCELLVPEDISGHISFPNRTWNGIIGDFKIDQTLYTVSNNNRDIPVKLTKGKHFFLLQVSGKFDDLYCHLEFCFPREIEFVDHGEDRLFFVIGPTDRIIPVIDGFDTVYGGLDEYNRMEAYTEYHRSVFGLASMEELKEQQIQVNWIASEYVFYDEYLLSLIRNEKVLKEYSVSPKHLGVLWNNQEVTVIDPPKEGDYRRVIIDFKNIYVGSLEFSIYAPKGTVIDVYGFENMYQGEIDYTIGLNNGIRYTCKEGWQTYRCMARMGMRYAVITVRNCKEQVKLREFYIRHSTYATTNYGDFQCDDYLLNRIWSMSRDTHKLCLEDSFTDCPTFEQVYWIGDAQISAETNAYVYGEYDFIRHNQELAVSALENTPLMNALTPTDWNTSIPMWMMNWIISVFQCKNITDNKEAIDKLYPKMKEALVYYSDFIQPDGAFLINAWNMMDWADMDIHNYGVVTGQQAILAYCYRSMAEYARHSRKSEDYKLFSGCDDKLLSYIDNNLWDDNKKMFLDGWSPEYGYSKTVSIQSHTLLLLYDGIRNPEKRSYAEKYLEQQPKEFIEVGSPFMLYYVYECLINRGKVQEVLEDIKKRWGAMLEYDSTTCWEVFPGFYENSRTRSYCHSWSAAPASLMIKYLLGVQMTEEGFKKVRIELPDTELQWCRGTIPTPFGPIHADWKKTTTHIEYILWIPEDIIIENAEATGYHLTVHTLSNEKV